jgi:membrane protein DedA with SNARE-associated domain
MAVVLTVAVVGAVVGPAAGYKLGARGGRLAMEQPGPIQGSG